MPESIIGDESNPLGCHLSPSKPVFFTCHAPCIPFFPSPLPMPACTPHTSFQPVANTVPHKPVFYVRTFKCVVSRPAEDWARVSLCARSMWLDTGRCRRNIKCHPFPPTPKKFIRLSKNPVAMDFQMSEIGLGPGLQF